MIFDLDGTLWDSTREVGRAWTDMFAKHGVGIVLTPERMKITMGRTVPEIGEALLGHIEPERRKRILDDCCDEENRRLRLYGGVLYDGVAELLPKLAENYDLFVVSNCEDGYVESFML